MAIKALGYVVIGTQKLAAWRRFLLDVVGIMPAGSGPGGAELYRLDDRPFRFWIEPFDGERLLAAAYEISDAAALEALAQRLVAAGHPVAHGSPAMAAARGVDAFFRTSDPAGNGLEFYCGDTRDNVVFVSAQGVEGFVTGALGMGHAVVAAPDLAASHAFYRDVIGFHDTDVPRFYFGGGPPDDPGLGFVFMHADNGRHHSVAFGESPVPPSGCIHLMLEMTNLVDVGRCHDRMRLAGVPESATLGGHVNDEMTSFYMQTPSGFDLEVGCNGLVIDPARWQPTSHTRISEWGHVWAWQVEMAKAAAAQAEAAV
ncbi:VOC family protein [Sandarakinorhabdus sp.]|uniref:VOC family protein n=1 Tax=Sandarakinorhabdus sp. TaxID=1916663 RepID=UPI0028B00213|nr:VOC family protein [Sandarakinorhabdus sp.]